MTSNCSRTLQISELLDSIIDYLEDDIPSLKVCSLLCRAWRSSADRHLLSSLLLDEKPVSPVSRRSDNESDTTPGANVGRNYAWLVTRPRIVDHVQTVTVPKWLGGEHRIRCRHTRNWEFAFRIILDIMATFPHLRNLKIEGETAWCGSLDPFSYSTRTPLVPLKLDNLELHYDFHYFDDVPLHDLLIDVSEVKNLVLDGMDYEGCCDWLEEADKERAEVPRTKITANEVRHICRILSTFFDTSNLTSLIFVDHDLQGSVEPLIAFINQYTPRVKHVGFGISVALDAPADQFDLSCLRALRRVDFAFTLFPMSTARNQVLWNLMGSALLSALPGSLQQFSVKILLGAGGAEPAIACRILSELDLTLLNRVHHRQPSLCTVKIHLTAGRRVLSLPDVEELIRENVSVSLSQLVKFPVV